MNSQYLLISYLMVVFATSEKAVYGQQNSYKTPKSVFLAHCKHFNCPDIDDPQCVKMRLSDIGLLYYFIAVNKCELEYLKCRDDVEGTVVAMKFCQHNAELVAGKQTISEEGKAHIRVKRRAVRARPSINPHLREAVKEKTKSLGKVEMEQYEAACPTVCPSRDVMVCAKCQHGVYRTFSSVCHMRMFGCNHTDEIMQLESRGPCVSSSPFMEPGMQPQGRVVEPDDDDIVLRFIRCRDKGLLCPGDPTVKLPFRDGFTYNKEILSFLKFHNEKKTWHEAIEICKQEGATLFFPENSMDAIEMLSVWKLTNSDHWGSNYYLWVGIKRESPLSKDFVTIDGQSKRCTGIGRGVSQTITTEKRTVWKLIKLPNIMTELVLADFHFFACFKSRNNFERYAGTALQATASPNRASFPSTIVPEFILNLLIILTFTVIMGKLSLTSI